VPLNLASVLLGNIVPCHTSPQPFAEVYPQVGQVAGMLMFLIDDDAGSEGMEMSEG